MKRLPALLTASAVALALLLTPAAHAADDKEVPNLGKMDLGSHVTGPNIRLKDLRNRVVVVEYWGITCGPCIAAIPHTTDLAKQYGHDKLVIVANQSWGASDKQCKEVWEKHAKNNHVAVINGGKLPGFTTTSVPRAVIFDHTGKFLWEGHPASMDRVLADAIANMPDKAEPEEEAADEEAVETKRPDPIVTGVALKYFEREAERINQQDRSVYSALAKLRRTAEKSSRQDQVDEAKAILDALSAWSAERAESATAALKTDPATAYAAADRLSTWLGRDELAEPFTAIKAQLEADKQQMDTIRATLMLREVKALAESIGLGSDADASAERPDTPELRVITRDLGRIIKAWPDTAAGKEAVELIEKWDLGE